MGEEFKFPRLAPTCELHNDDLRDLRFLFESSRFPGISMEACHHSRHLLVVDGRNPAPVGRWLNHLYSVVSPLFTVVWLPIVPTAGFLHISPVYSIYSIYSLVN